MAQRADGVIEKHKAFAYITWQGRLLVFRQPDFPEAGVQVPAGTIEVDEMPEAAVLREAYEETGLAHLTVVRFLGTCRRDMSDYGIAQIHVRHFFHLSVHLGAEQDTSQDHVQTWRHLETQSNNPQKIPIVFEFWWAALPDGIPNLIADHGQMLAMLSL